MINIIKNSKKYIYEIFLFIYMIFWAFGLCSHIFPENLNLCTISKIEGEECGKNLFYDPCNTIYVLLGMFIYVCTYRVLEINGQKESFKE